MTHEEAVAYWYNRINYELRAATPDDFKLERMRAFLADLGNPQDRLRIVHLTGTKGKGSTAAILESVLRASGYRVGLFTSPHLVNVDERIQLDRVPITPPELASLMTELRTVIDGYERAGIAGPTFFEIGTALGLLYFVRRRAEVVLLEVGLGGRFDSTNVCNPMAAVITSIGLDHTQQLGNTVELIAYQKAGIIKRGRPVVCGPIADSPLSVIREVAVAEGAPMTVVDADVRYTYRPGRSPRIQVTTPTRAYPEFALNLLGAHQAANAATAMATLEVLARQGLSITDTALSVGLKTVRWPARVEVVSESPTVILDCAHNAPSASSLVETLRSAFTPRGRKRCIFAVSSDKPYQEMLAILVPYFDEFLFTRYGNNPRSVPPEKLLAAAPNAVATCYATAAEAWSAARTTATPDDLICITGSVFLAGELRERIQIQNPSGIE